MRLLLKITKLLPLLSLLLAGCFWGDEFQTRHVVGHYYLDEFERGSGAWYLHFKDEEFGLADALINCPIVEAGYNERCIIARAVCTNPQFYIVPLTQTKNRETARHSIRGPFSKQKFEMELRKICGNERPQFDAKLTNSSKW